MKNEHEKLVLPNDAQAVIKLIKESMTTHENYDMEIEKESLKVSHES